jgi:hypothetical protein
VPHDQSVASIAAANAAAGDAVSACRSGPLPAGYVAVGVRPRRRPEAIRHTE